MEEKFYTTEQVANTLQVHQFTILRFIKQGKLKGYKIGRMYRIPESEMKRFLEARITTAKSKSPKSQKKVQKEKKNEAKNNEQEKTETQKKTRKTESQKPQKSSKSPDKNVKAEKEIKSKKEDNGEHFYIL